MQKQLCENSNFSSGLTESLFFFFLQTWDKPHTWQVHFAPSQTCELTAAIQPHAFPISHQSGGLTVCGKPTWRNETWAEEKLSPFQYNCDSTRWSWVRLPVCCGRFYHQTGELWVFHLHITALLSLKDSHSYIEFVTQKGKRKRKWASVGWDIKLNEWPDVKS